MDKLDIFKKRIVNPDGDIRERVVYQRHLADDIWAEASGVYATASGIIDQRLDAVASGILSEHFVLSGEVKNVSNPHYIYALDNSVFPDASGTRSVGTSTTPWASGAFMELYVPEIMSDVIVHGNISVEGTINQYNIDIYDTIELNVSGDTRLGDGSDDTIELVGLVSNPSGNVTFDDNIMLNNSYNVYFRDTDTYIHSSTDGQLDIDADVELEIVAPTIDFQASSTITSNQTITFSASPAIITNPASDSIALEFPALASAWAFKYATGIGVDNTGLYFDLADTAFEFKIGNVDLFRILADNATFNATIESGARGTAFDGGLTGIAAADTYYTSSLSQAFNNGMAITYVGGWFKADATRNANESVAMVAEGIGAAAVGFNSIGGTNTVDSNSGGLIWGYWSGSALDIWQRSSNATGVGLKIRQDGTADIMNWKDAGSLIGGINDTGQIYFRNTAEDKIYLDGDAGGNKISLNASNEFVIESDVNVLLEGGVVINEAGADVDVRIESVNEQYLFVVDAGNDSVGVVKGAWVDGSYEPSSPWNTIAAGQANFQTHQTFSSQPANTNVIYFHKSTSNTMGTKTATGVDDVLLNIMAKGVRSDNSAFNQGGQIRFIQEGAAGATNVPTRFELRTANGTGQNSNKFIMDSTGAVGTVNGTYVASAMDGELNVISSNTTARIYIDTYDDGSSQSGLIFRKSDSDTIGTVAQTGDTDGLGTINWRGASSAPAVVDAARISVTQDGNATGGGVPTKMTLETWTAAGSRNTDQLLLNTNGTISHSGDIIPSASGTLDLGSTAYAFDDAYIDKVYLEANPTTPFQAATKQYVDDQYGAVAASITGELKIWPTNSAPAGYLFCDGSAVSRSTYSSLFDVIGTIYGVGDGSTTFNLPDLRGRIPLGRDDMGGSSANRVTASEADNLGQSEGAESHTLITSEMPAHTHPQNANTLLFEGSGSTHGASPGLLKSGGTTQSTGGDGSHNNVQPYITLNYIIKT